MSDNTRLQFDSIGKSFFGVQVLKEITFGVSAGSIIGLVGENGAGKSTLMNILGGVLAPDAGTMTLDGVAYAPANPVAATRSGVVFVHQELNLFANLSIADNLFITDFPRGSLPPFISRRKASSQAEELLQRVGLKRDPTTTVDLLSPGERQQLEIAKALKGAPKLVILDEPTTSLTTRETDQLFALMEELREMGTSVIYISHILGDVQQLSDRVVILRDGTLVDQGPIEDFDSHTMVSRMVGRALDRLYPDKTAEIQPQVALEVEAVTEPGMVRDVSFSIRAGEVVGMFGLMGAGRSELARILFGLDPSSSGTVRVNGQERPQPTLAPPSTQVSAS